jgi:hypothetical protein
VRRKFLLVGTVKSAMKRTLLRERNRPRRNQETAKPSIWIMAQSIWIVARLSFLAIWIARPSIPIFF